MSVKYTHTRIFTCCELLGFLGSEYFKKNLKLQIVGIINSGNKNTYINLKLGKH